MAKLSINDLAGHKIESDLPENSRDVVTNVKGRIRSVQVKELNGDVKLFINVETLDGSRRYADVITFKESNVENTLRFLAFHVNKLFEQIDNTQFFTNFTEVVERLAEAMKSKSEFVFSTVRSNFNSEYVDVLYGDEEPRQ